MIHREAHDMITVTRERTDLKRKYATLGGAEVDAHVVTKRRHKKHIRMPNCLATELMVEKIEAAVDSSQYVTEELTKMENPSAGDFTHLHGVAMLYRRRMDDGKLCFKKHSIEQPATRGEKEMCGVHLTISSPARKPAGIFNHIHLKRTLRR